MLILGIETSCDETAAAVVRDGREILSNVVVSQIDIFAEYGGVIPEVAARSHLEAMMPVVDKALLDAGVSWNEIDAIAVTHAPGLLGSLLIGTLTARTLSILHNKPLYAVHHLKSHVYANWLDTDANILSRAASPRPVATGEARSSSPCQAPEALQKAIPAKHYIILCPHYEGYDERILSIVDYKISLGKYVLTGGELPALIIIDSVVRLIPGVLGGEKSAEIESFSDGDNLEYPQYTKPYDFRGMTVPDVLLSGNHGEIKKWREEHSGKML